MEIDQNTTNRYPTHFLRGVELVQSARKFYNVHSENWTYPTQFKYGWEQGRYYAELWSDGMDWQSSFWLIEKLGYEKPQIMPFIISTENNNAFNQWYNKDFSMFFDAVCWYRQDKFWIKQDPLGYYTDIPWAYVNKVDSDKEKDAGQYKLRRYYFEHHSQPKVEFWIIDDILIPEKYRRTREKTNKLVDGNTTITTQYPSFDIEKND